MVTQLYQKTALHKFQKKKWYHIKISSNTSEIRNQFKKLNLKILMQTYRDISKQLMS